MLNEARIVFLGAHCKIECTQTMKESLDRKMNTIVNNLTSFSNFLRLSNSQKFTVTTLTRIFTEYFYTHSFEMMKPIVILFLSSFYLFLSLLACCCQVAAVQVLVAPLYRVVLYRTVIWLYFKLFA